MTNTTKPSRQEMIDAIYAKIANKDLSFGCKIFHKVESWKRSFKARIITDKIEKDYGTFYWVKLDSENSVTWLQEKEMEIIGHPVMIGDVIDFIEKNTQEVKPEQTKWEGVIKIQLWCSRGKAIEIFTGHIIFVWQNKRFPIEEQPDKCIDFIYSLISK